MAKKKFYEIHVNIPKYGYSVAVESNTDLSHDEIINLAKKLSKFEEPSDEKFIDYVGEINENEYQYMI